MVRARVIQSNRPRRRPASSSRAFGEFERIRHIRRLFDTSKHSTIKVGIGDDAAVLRASSEDLVWTIDSSVENIHFRFGWLTEADIGWRSFQAAASDLAAMGARPVGALSALEVPKDFPGLALKRLLDGQAQASKHLGCPVMGGNLSAAAVLSITTTVLGRGRHSLLRSDARVGDELWLVGDVGMAAAGLACLADSDRKHRGHAVDHCVAAWRRPEALIKRGYALIGRAHAAIDVSDGLVGDALHIAEASGVGIEIDLGGLEESLDPDLCRVSERFARPALDFALHGGEDYALLVTGSAANRPRWARRIGHVVSGLGVCGVAKGGRQTLGRGFDHFRS